MRILILLSSILISNICYASSEGSIETRKIEFASTDENKIEALEKEVQSLLGRIEILEHTVSQLKQQLTIVSDNEAMPPSPSLPPANDNQVDDIFSIPEKSVNTLESSDTQQNLPEVNTEKKEYDLALAMLKDNKYEAAEEKFAKFISNYPKSNLISNAYFWYGETFLRRNVYDKAALNYLKGYKNSPKGAKASDSLLKLALSLGEMGKKPEACGMLTKLEKEFPSRPASSIKRAKDAKIKFGCK